MQQLGVRDDTLSAEEKSFLDDNGYLLFPRLLHMELVTAFRERIERLAAEQRDGGLVKEGFQEGTVVLVDIANMDPMFDFTFTHPRVLAAVWHVLPCGFKVSTTSCRFAQPGGGQQELHPDWHPAWWRDRKSPKQFFSCNTLWMLDDFTAGNGATRLVPGSHRRLAFPEDDMTDFKAEYPGQVQAIAPAGSVVVFTGHTWHGGMLNRTGAPRRSMTTYFCRRDQPPQVNQFCVIRPQTRARLSDAARYVFGA